MLIAKDSEHPAEDQQAQKASLCDSVWYTSLIFRLEFQSALCSCMLDKKTSLLCESCDANILGHPDPMSFVLFLVHFGDASKGAAELQASKRQRLVRVPNLPEGLTPCGEIPGSCIFVYSCACPCFSLVSGPMSCVAMLPCEFVSWCWFLGRNTVATG